MKRSLLSFALLSAVLVLTGCNGTVSSVSFPAESPWEAMATGILSPTDDLVAVSAGAGLESELVPELVIAGIQAAVACQGTDGPYIETCTDRTCDAQTVCGTDTVIESGTPTRSSPVSTATSSRPAASRSRTAPERPGWGSRSTLPTRAGPSTWPRATAKA